MFNSIPEHLDAFYECLDYCMDCIASRMSVYELRDTIDDYYANNEITESQYNIFINIIKEIQK